MISVLWNWPNSTSPTIQRDRKKKKERKKELKTHKRFKVNQILDSLTVLNKAHNHDTQSYKAVKTDTNTQ